MKKRVLIVEDDQDMCKLLDVDLRRRGLDVAWETSADEALNLLQKEAFDVILADINMPGMNGLELCERVVNNRPDVPVIIMTAFGSIETAVSAIRAGAYDFITKPVELDILFLALDRALKHGDLQEKVKVLSQAVKKASLFDELVGDSQPMQDLYAMISQVADTETSVLITGESGSGKELVAQALHRNSKRRDKPYITLNCSTLSETLLESELFGYKKGAFTDAKTDKKGLFLEADGGSLFLDEIAELPLALQPKLLRALEEHRVRPVGDSFETAFDVRIIAATNCDLEERVQDGLFRDDLFYRLNVIHMEIPSLSSRGTDILLLAQHFLNNFADRLNKKVTGISKPAAEKLLAYHWPGNVRELRNAIEHAVVITKFEDIAVDDLPSRLQVYERDFSEVGFFEPDALVSIQELEYRYIRHVLKKVKNNQTLAAKILGLDRKTLYRKMKRYHKEKVTA